MSTGQTDYKAFRQRLDTMLRQKNPAALRDFLIAEGQWQQDASNDAEAAMWMMIAASSALADLHDEARHWLLSNGHEAEANAIFGRRSGGSTAPRGPARPANKISQGAASKQGQGSRGRSSTPPAQPPRASRAQPSERHASHDHKRSAGTPPKQPNRDLHAR